MTNGCHHDQGGGTATTKQPETKPAAKPAPKPPPVKDKTFAGK